MTGPGGGFVLAVDLGTSHTVAMLRWPDGRTRPLLFDGQPLLPSAVHLDGERRLHVGRDALRLGYADPARIEPNPKRRIDDDGVLLGDVTVPVADLLAALLGAVAREAVATAGFLPPAVLTYPAAWGRLRRAVLQEALGRAGWPAATELVPEPVAAARYFADVLRRPVPVGAALAVFDFGGGTLDVAVVRNEGLGPDGRPRFEVAASGGADDLGGLDLDAALVDHLGKSLAGGEPEAWGALTDPRTLAQWRARRQFWEDVRGAKEMLSRSALAPVPVPGVEQAVHLTRDELEAAAGPLIRRGVTEAGAVIRAAGLTPGELAGLFLVGGSSRVPLVARLLHADLGVAPTVLEQPELPVAEGAIAAAAAARAGAAAAESASGTQPWTPDDLTGDRSGTDESGGTRMDQGGEWGAAAPVPDDALRYQRGVAEAATPTPTPATIPTQPTGPAGGEPPQEYAEPVDPWATGEAAAFGPGGAPAYGGDFGGGAGGNGGRGHGGPGGTGGGPGGGGGHGPGGGRDGASGGGGGHGGPGGGGAAGGPRTMAGAPNEPWLASAEQAGGTERSPAYRRKWVLIGASALVVVVGVGAALAWAFWPGYRAIDFQPLGRTPAVTLDAATVFSSNLTDSVIVGNRVYYATENDDGTLGVVAAEADTGKQLWAGTEAGVATGWEQIVGLPDGVAAITEVDSGSDQRRLVVLDGGSGKVRWQHTMARADSVRFSGPNAVFTDSAGKRLVAMRRSDGGKSWELPDPASDSSTVPVLYSSLTPDDLSGPARPSGSAFAADLDDDTRLLQVFADRSARVVDAEDGGVVVAPKAGIADTDGLISVTNNRVVAVETTGTTQRVLAFDLSTLDSPKVLGQAAAGAKITALASCGAEQVCWIESLAYDGKENKVAGVRVADGAKTWRVTLPGAESIVPVGDNALVTQKDSSATKVTFIDAAAGKVRWSADGAAGRLDGGNVLLFSRTLSTTPEDPSLAGRHLGDDPVQLGPMSGVRTASCSWNTEVIACVADKNLTWQRFAG
ncbi:Hsp70 family protein [Actinoplanes sp. NPDC051470]|uniref:Hsp70 family protein n=1 Tax=Actinoplanes sp. NPDC051470 TaxID=3157224 RepID=UPI003436DDC2